MTRKLIITALITTPLIVINAVLPIYLEERVTMAEAINMASVIASYASFIWGVNIILVTKVKVAKRWILYVYSFAMVLAVSYPVRWLVGTEEAISTNIIRNPAFPAVNAFVFNAIVWVIIELIQSGEQKKRAQALIDQLKIENLEAQKQSLIRQIQPHFLFNALSTLKSLIWENQKDAETYTVRLSNFLRYSFASESSDIITLKQELAFTMNYIELQSIRFEDAFTFDIDIPDGVLTKKLPVLALQTLVENIFKHNYFSEHRPLHFSITYADETLVVWNEKTSLKLTERNETGLANLNQRYELTNGASIVIEDSEKAFSVTIPLLKG